MKYLGIDPAIRNVGWGIIDNENQNINYIDSGVFVSEHNDLKEVLANISKKIGLIIEEYKPSIVGMEKIFLNKNPESTIKLAHARGAIMSKIGYYGIKFHEIAPNTIKKAITGNGKASKEQVLQMVKILFPKSNITSYDEADAIAIAYTSTLIR